MSHNTISTCHSLNIIPLFRVLKFAKFSQRVSMTIHGDPIDAKAVPGSLKISTSTEDGIIKKTISFERAGVSECTSDLLEQLKASRLVATYVDEAGKQRVVGSPSWPLSLDYTTEGGVFAVLITGEDTKPDSFLEE